MLVAAFVSFASFMLMLQHLPDHWLRRIVGYKGLTDTLLHGTILWMFLGTSTAGLLQAEAAGILFSLYLRGYHKWIGYERMEKDRRGKRVWKRTIASSTPGWLMMILPTRIKNELIAARGKRVRQPTKPKAARKARPTGNPTLRAVR